MRSQLNGLLRQVTSTRILHLLQPQRRYTLSVYVYRTDLETSDERTRLVRSYSVSRSRPFAEDACKPAEMNECSRYGRASGSPRASSHRAKGRATAEKEESPRWQPVRRVFDRLALTVGPRTTFAGTTVPSHTSSHSNRTRALSRTLPLQPRPRRTPTIRNLEPRDLRHSRATMYTRTPRRLIPRSAPTTRNRTSSLEESAHAEKEGTNAAPSNGQREGR